MDSQTTDITHFAVVFIMTSQLNQWKHYEARLITYDVIMKNNGKVRDVRSLACKIKVLNGRVPGTWKWTIQYLPSWFYYLLFPIFFYFYLLPSSI